MNPYRTTDLAKSYRADDIQAATTRRRFEAAAVTTGSSEAAAPSFDPRPRSDDSEIDVPSFLKD